MGNLCGEPSASNAGYQNLSKLTKEIDYDTYLNDLNEKVDNSFDQNPSIHFIESSVETVESEGINFELRMIKSLAKKPTLKTTKSH